MNMANKQSVLRPQILDRHTRGMIQKDIAKELNCSKAIVSEYILEFEFKKSAVRAKREECIKRQNSSDYDIRMLCTENKTCKTCSCSLEKPDRGNLK